MYLLECIYVSVCVCFYQLRWLCLIQFNYLDLGTGAVPEEGGMWRWRRGGRWVPLPSRRGTPLAASGCPQIQSSNSGGGYSRVKRRGYPRTRPAPRRCSGLRRFRPKRPVRSRGRQPQSPRRWIWGLRGLFTSRWPRADTLLPAAGQGLA